jgi:hypothetical protein
MIKNIFSKFKGDNGSECDVGNVSSQALSACLAKRQFEGCFAQELLPFRAAVLLGGPLFVIH